VAFASSTILLPLAVCVTLTDDLLTGVRRHWGYHVPHRRDARGVGVLSTPGAGVRARESCDSRALPHDRRLEYPSFRRLKLTKPRRGFTCVHPSTLSLTRFNLMGRSLLRHVPWLRTPPLPATRARAGTGIGHAPECSFPSYTTLTVRLRVAHSYAYSRPSSVVFLPAGGPALCHRALRYTPVTQGGAGAPGKGAT